MHGTGTRSKPYGSEKPMQAHVRRFDLTGRVALVTGASRGIGEAIATALAEHGAHVVIASRKLAECERVAGELRAAGHRASARACHIGEVDQITATIDSVVAEHGALDILVNNAAANPYFGPAIDTDLGAYQKTVDVNLRGYFFATTHAIKQMQKQGKGAILNVASVNGVRPGPMQAIYSITKAGILSMTQAFAKECAPLGVRVNALLPGFTDTKFASALTQNETVRGMILDQVPMRRIADPGEMAGAAVYLVSDAASYTTGAHLVVDGGYLT